VVVWAAAPSSPMVIVKTRKRTTNHMCLVTDIRLSPLRSACKTDIQDRRHVASRVVCVNHTVVLRRPVPGTAFKYQPEGVTRSPAAAVHYLLDDVGDVRRLVPLGLGRRPFLLDVPRLYRRRRLQFGHVPRRAKGL